MREQQQEEMKQCAAIYHRGPRLLPKTEFWRRTWSRDGLQSYCKACARLDNQQRYQQNREHLLHYNKLYRLRKGCKHTEEHRQRHILKKREKRLSERRAKARFLVDLVAQEYAGAKTKREEPQGVAIRLIRQITKLDTKEIAAILGCPEETVFSLLKRARGWTRHDKGDIRVALRIEHVLARYRLHFPARRFRG